MTADLLVFVDLESDGLEPVGGHLLELGIVLTTPDLTEVDRASWVIGDWPGETLADVRNNADADADRMHETSLLWEDCSRHDTVTTGAVDVEALSWLDRHGVFGDGKPLLWGSSVHFDSRWMELHLPRLRKPFSHRLPDVSSTREQIRAWAPALLGDPSMPVGRDLHRALPDLEDTIALASWMRRRVFLAAVRHAKAMGDV